MDDSMKLTLKSRVISFLLVICVSLGAIGAYFGVVAQASQRRAEEAKKLSDAALGKVQGELNALREKMTSAQGSSVSCLANESKLKDAIQSFAKQAGSCEALKVQINGRSAKS